IGEEAAHQLFGAHHKMLSAAVSVCGGEELQWLGDGVLAGFESVADAVRCAIAMQQAARRPINGTRLEIRVGINTGDAVRHEDGYFGNSLTIAKRLCSAASAGQILCSKLVTAMLASRNAFSFRELPEAHLDGITAPLNICEVIFER